MKISIRHAEPGDCEAIHGINASSGVIRGTLQLPYPSMESLRKKLSSPEDGLYLLVALVESDLVGHLSMKTHPATLRRRHAARMGMAVRDDWANKGVGTALVGAAVEMADKWLDLKRLELHVYTDNEPAIRLYEKFGFVIEGTFWGYAFRDGHYVDAHAMARVRL